MGLKSFISLPFSKLVAKATDKWSSKPFITQQNVFDDLIENGRNTVFGKKHSFSSIKNYDDFKRAVPIVTYEDIKPYIERIKNGEKDILWKGKPIYLSKTSGTTSGVKYIPITKESIPNHINSARNALLLYIAETKRSNFVDGKLIFLSGSPELDMVGGIPTGRLSGIVNHHVPGYLRKNQMPSYTTNCFEDWEQKVDAIVEETFDKNMTLISGIPPWVQMYFDKIIKKTGKQVGDVFPDFSLFVYGGVNYEPYRNKLESSIGRKVDSIELYPASEGFIAYQNRQHEEGLLLILNSGIYYEFIPADEYFNEHPTRINLEDVQVGVNYALIMNTNAGLWGYSIGDTVKFVSTNPYKIVVTGRISHFISAFGEHVIAEEVEKALQFACSKQSAEIIEFTVAPEVSPAEGLPYHEWFIEFGREPNDMDYFRNCIDESLQKQNIYYQDLIAGKILQPLKIRAVKPNAFINYMKAKGKLGGQNKLPRLSNDRKIANDLMAFDASSE
ncbi:MAG: GH3 auxin-responsive promoter family protein [Bacteroidota bacterium]